VSHPEEHLGARHELHGCDRALQARDVEEHLADLVERDPSLAETTETLVQGAEGVPLDAVGFLSQSDRQTFEEDLERQTILVCGAIDEPENLARYFAHWPCSR
jgi:hypothetical protein